MTSKQRACLRGLANGLDPIIQIGKGGVTPEIVESVSEAYNKKELIKLSILKTCLDDPYAIADVLAERTHSEVVQVIGRRIVLYKRDRENPRIELP